MQISILVALLVLLSFANAEYCHDTDSCRQTGLTSCNGNSHLNCDPNCHQCVCASGAPECQTRDDCSGRCGPMHITYCRNGKCICEMH
ncbi:serine protease inhibitor Cvsi-2-like [Mercenaria mercenaria]|uniref:serine protease inhibitor Cvsi-2-like n=1 Tax=Mercenaria mercenaria TaxID=6596 RepID=UPI00234E7883|nr:serine protease inhibitor Cvsi-2-like [Mercenaria mercenaria]